VGGLAISGIPREDRENCRALCAASVRTLDSGNLLGLEDIYHACLFRSITSQKIVFVDVTDVIVGRVG
jgi:hypothetical protein